MAIEAIGGDCAPSDSFPSDDTPVRVPVDAKSIIAANGLLDPMLRLALPGAERYTCTKQEFERVNDQIHVRNAEAAHLARTLAKQTGKTINDVVLDALRQYRGPKAARKPARKLSEWRALLAADLKQRKARETPIESLYDETTGLPK